MISKFQKEIQLLLDNQVINQETVKRIETFYASRNEEKPNRLFTIFGVIGATLVGLGIILILAHNWDNFSKSIKTVLAFAPLLIGQFFVGYSLFKAKAKSWVEASGAFLFFAVGSSIGLVSQIYNIPGDLSSYLLTWTLLCIPLVYILKSNTLVFLCLVFATYYGCNYGYGYFSSSHTPWWYLLMVITLIPQYFQLIKSKKDFNFTSICNWLFPLSLVIVLGAFTETNSGFGFLMYILLFGVFYNIGKLKFFYNQKLRRNGYLIIGSLGTVITLLITSFKWIWNDIFRSEFIFNPQEAAIAVLLFVSASLLVYRTTQKEKNNDLSLFQIVFFVFALLFSVAQKDEVIPLVLINVLLLVLGVNAIKIGADRFHFGILNYGLLIITALIVCRFFDTDMSFVLRGLLFVSVGVGFFATNYMMLQKQKKTTKSISK
ncbi:DUF2157 domain-containing protein [Winogradskyella haliclonae]|uniref:DUF2157 domain-containing protein n=1 Tax=Winogradskyella haliclonae TaxID=2048558 RepID=A0ABQ2BW01_9FLAO|nr:DUF2157 domain-containing protein [Winogradskyella haliclonae]GGI55713.1 hypothetical protein GCM10011444_00220 [Winogradskyella haliclonae]